MSTANNGSRRKKRRRDRSSDRRQGVLGQLRWVLIPVPYLLFSNLNQLDDFHRIIIHWTGDNNDGYAFGTTKEDRFGHLKSLENANVTSIMMYSESLAETNQMSSTPTSAPNNDGDNNQRSRQALVTLDGLDNTARQSSDAPGRLYYCGWDAAPQYLFPDYDYQGFWPVGRRPFSQEKYQRQKTRRRNSNVTISGNDHSRDILVIGLFGPCLGQRRFKVSNVREIVDWKLFEGKVLYVNGEAYGEIIDPSIYIPNQFQMGPYFPSLDYHNHSIAVSFMAWYFGLMTINQQQDSRMSSMSSSLSSSSTIWETLENSNRLRNNLTTSAGGRGQQNGRIEGVVYLASKCLRFRQKFAQQISTIVPVYHGKGCKPPIPRKSKHNHTIILLDDDVLLHGGIDNTSNTEVSISNGTLDGGRYGWQNNHELYARFKYCLVMENTAKDGYMTEKILNAFLGGCLPIYYGSKWVFEIFNPESFVFVDINNPQPALDRIKYLQDHPETYDTMMSSPILTNGRTTLESYFSVFPHLGNGTLNKQLRSMMGLDPLGLTRNWNLMMKEQK